MSSVPLTPVACRPAPTNTLPPVHHCHGDRDESVTQLLVQSGIPLLATPGRDRINVHGCTLQPPRGHRVASKAALPFATAPIAIRAARKDTSLVAPDGHCIPGTRQALYYERRGVDAGKMARLETLCKLLYDPSPPRVPNIFSRDCFVTACHRPVHLRRELVAATHHEPDALVQAGTTHRTMP